jgi:hypothetical protein
MKALVFICQKSIFLREKQMRKEKSEEAEVMIELKIDDNVNEEEDGDDILSDEDEEDDEDYDCNEFGDIELYDSKLDSIDEVLLFRDTLANLETSNGPVYQALVSLLSAQEKDALNVAINTAMQLQSAAAQPTQ